MFKHILIPTDGSEVAVKAIRAGVALAKEMGAKVTGLYADESPAHVYRSGFIVPPEIATELERRAREYAQKKWPRSKAPRAARACRSRRWW
jgi:nucleotide-binding universal stress UspA family protein